MEDHQATPCLALTLFPTPRNLCRVRLRTAQSAQPFVRCMPQETLEAKPHGFCVRGRAAGLPRCSKELLVDVERLLHMDEFAISVWLVYPGTRAREIAIST